MRYTPQNGGLKAQSADSNEKWEWLCYGISIPIASRKNDAILLSNHLIHAGSTTDFMAGNKQRLTRWWQGTWYKCQAFST